MYKPCDWYPVIPPLVLLGIAAVCLIVAGVLLLWPTAKKPLPLPERDKLGRFTKKPAPPTL